MPRLWPFFWWFQFQLIQSLICWFPLRLAQNWSRSLAIIEKNFKKEASNISIHSNDAMSRNSSLNERTEKAPAKQRSEKAPTKECTVRAPAKEATGKAPAKECTEKPLRNRSRKKPLWKSARINLFKVTDTLELPLGNNMRRKRMPALDISWSAESLRKRLDEKNKSSGLTQHLSSHCRYARPRITLQGCCAVPDTPQGWPLLKPTGFLFFFNAPLFCLGEKNPVGK